MPLHNVLPGLKTHIIVFGGLLTIVGMFFHGDLTLADASTKALQFLGLSTLRIGVSGAQAAITSALGAKS